MRGNRRPYKKSGVYWRSIPRVCGGTTRLLPTCGVFRGLSPRVRGTWGRRSCGIPICGLSPRVRGNRQGTARRSGGQRSIPACAGEPIWLNCVIKNPNGLSPRVRGNRSPASRIVASSRSIPACAGNRAAQAAVLRVVRSIPAVCGGTRPQSPRPVLDRVYPRVCGGTEPKAGVTGYIWVYPRVCGGPRLCNHLVDCTSVYPRVCGGTGFGKSLAAQQNGLSPRVRGNRYLPRLPLPTSRSIPACAGEPTAAAIGATQLKVYPRVCGGTVAGPVDEGLGVGLSPRVRGNLRLRSARRWPGLSIPACAGEPVCCPTRPLPTGVYPRVCGGTGPPHDTALPNPGLSPRVRGNRLGLLLPAFWHRSIPACAGNRRRCRAKTFRGGSIPACAGEPTCIIGATLHLPSPGSIPACAGEPPWSPRLEAGVRRTGSIPACAGEPATNCGTAAGDC